MKKSVLILLMTLTSAIGMSQTIEEAVYVYRNDGQFNAFLREEIDSITYSRYDEDSLLYDEFVTQLVYTVDSLYKIPIANIDSVSFVTPETEYTPQVIKMEPLLPYVVAVEGMTLTFSSDIPSSMFPKKGDVLVLDNFNHELFPVGFAGRMSSQEGMKIICDSVSFEDIYEHILCYGHYTAIEDNSTPKDSRLRFVAISRAGGNVSSTIKIKGALGSDKTGLYGSVDGQVGIYLRFTFKYDAGSPAYFDISLTPELSLSLETGAKGTLKKSLVSAVPLFLMPIGELPFYFKLSGGPILETSLEASLVAKTEAKLGYRFGIKYEDNEFKWNGGNTSKWFSKPTINGNIKGNVFFGVLLESGIYSYGDIVSLTTEKKAGAELEGNISENIQNPNSYNDIKDAYLDVNLRASAAFKAEAKIFKLVKLSAKYDIFSGKVNIYKFKLAPSFTKPTVDILKSSAIVSVSPYDNLLFPVSIGLGVWDESNAIKDIQFCEGTYSSRDSWPLNEYRTVFSGLAPNTKYTVRPLIKLLGGTITCPPEEKFEIPVKPVTLDVYDIQDSSAIAFGRIEGYEALGENIECGIGYTAEHTGRAHFPVTAFTGEGEFYTHLIALKPNTTYKYFAYVIVDGEYLTGEEKEFTTKGDAEPYGVLSEEGTLLTYYYDGKKNEREGEIVSVPYRSKDIERVSFDASFVSYKPTSTLVWFYDMSNLSSIQNIEYLNTCNVTDMYFMFSGCSSLTSLDVSNFNTDNVTNMGYMFSGCSSLTSLGLSNFNTNNVTSMQAMFSHCSSLTSLNVSNFNTDNVTNMKHMFSGCSSLTGLDLSNFNTSNVTDMSSMFSGCSSLTSLNLNNFSTTGVTSMEFMFEDCRSLTTLDLSSFSTSNVTTMKCMFDRCCSIKNIDLSNFDMAKVQWGYEFRGCRSLRSIDMSNYHATNLVDDDLRNFFYSCDSLEYLNMTNFNVPKATTMKNLCSSLRSLKEINLSHANMNNVISMEDMFWGCDSLEFIDISDCNTSNVISMEGMFGYCRSLKKLNINGIVTTNVKNMARMFEYCESLTSLDLSHFDTSNILTIDEMFSGCKSLKSININGFSTRDEELGLFVGCNSLEKLEMNHFTAHNLTSFRGNNMWFCDSLKQIDMSYFYAPNLSSIELTYSLETINMSHLYAPELTSLDYGGKKPYCFIKEVDLSYGNAPKLWHIPFAYSTVTTLNISNYNASGITSSSFGLFAGMDSLENLNMSNFHAPNLLIEGHQLLGVLKSLKNLDISNIYVPKITDMSNLFSGLSSLTTINLTNFQTTNATNMYQMFSGCSSLKSLDLSGFDVSHVKDMSWMFYGCSSLKSLDLSGFDVSHVKDMSWMFYGCSSLLTIYGGDWRQGSVNSSNYMFEGCAVLTGGKGTKLGKNIYYDYVKNSDGETVRVERSYWCYDGVSSAHIDEGKDNPGLFTAK